MQRFEPPSFPELPDIESRNGVREATRRLHKYLRDFSTYLTKYNSDVGSALTPVYAELDYPAPSVIDNGKQRKLTCTVPNVILGYVRDISYDKDLQGLTVTGYVSADDTVEIVLKNDTGGSVTLAAGKFRFYVWPDRQSSETPASSVSEGGQAGPGAITYATTAEIADVADAEAAGASTTVPRGDHVHKIANDVVTYARMQNVSAASRLLGRGSAGGAGDPEEITLAGLLSMAGTVLSADGSVLVPVTADQTLNQSDTNLQDVTDLVFAMEANTAYRVPVELMLSAQNATADWKFGWTLPAGATMKWGPMAQGGSQFFWIPVGTGTSPDALLTESDTYSAGSFNGTHGLSFYAIIRCGGTAGNAQFRAAQNTSNASDNKILKDSHLLYREIQ